MKSYLVNIVATLIILLSSATACALGIAEPTLYSLLGQKLNADMELINMGELTTDELVVSIAYEDGTYAAPLKATLNKRSDGKAVVHLHSNEVINEPYLEFIVVIRWPQGELRREVTLLLDTPASR